MSIITINGARIGNVLTDLLMSDDLLPGDEASYQICKQVYSYHPLGRKMAESPIAMAMSQAREIAIPKAPEERCKKAFLDEWAALECDKRIFYLHTLKRVYGVASIALLEEGKDFSKP